MKDNPFYVNINFLRFFYVSNHGVVITYKRHWNFIYVHKYYINGYFLCIIHDCGRMFT